MNSSRQIGVATMPAFFALIALALWPAIAYSLPPLEDYANHLARMYILAALPNDGDLARFYEVDWRIVANLAMDLVVPSLAKIIGIYPAGQVFTAASLASIALGMMLLARALFGRWTVVPLLGLPFLYNGMLFIGSLNYFLGIGLALMTLAAWVALESGSQVRRLVATSLLVIILFFCHLFVVGLFGLGLLAYELQRLHAAVSLPVRKRLGQFLLPGLVFVPVIPLLLASATGHLSESTFWDFTGKGYGISLAVTAYSSMMAVVIAGLVATVLLVGWVTGRLTFHPLAPYLLVVGLIVYLLLPRMLFESYMADLRLPVALLYMLLACFELTLSSFREMAMFLAVALAALALRVVEVDAAWRGDARRSAEFKRSTAQIRRGSRVLSITADRLRGYVPSEYWLMHLPSLASIERSALTTRTFTVEGKQVLRVRPEFRNFTDQLDGSPPDIAAFLRYKASDNPSDYIYWRYWPKHFDYVYVLYTGPGFGNPDPEALNLVFTGMQFQLFEVRRVAR